MPERAPIWVGTPTGSTNVLMAPGIRPVLSPLVPIPHPIIPPHPYIVGCHCAKARWRKEILGWVLTADTVGTIIMTVIPGHLRVCMTHNHNHENRRPDMATTNATHAVERPRHHEAP